VYDLYDERGGRVYDDSTHVHPSEIRALRRAVRRHAGPVLELAAGSGRLTVPLLAMERDVTALELNDSMIALLHENVAGLPDRVRERLTVHRGDMTDFELGTSFGLVVLGAASISILDAAGRARLFGTVRRHLLPGGALLFSVVVPVHEEATENDTDTDTDVVMEVTGRTGRRYRVHEHRRAGADERLVGVYPVTADGDLPADAEVPVCVGTHRVLTLDPVLAEVSDAGFVVHDEHRLAYPDQGLTEIFLEVGDPR
jgi:methylation protein MtfA